MSNDEYQTKEFWNKSYKRSIIEEMSLYTYQIHWYLYQMEKQLIKSKLNADTREQR